MLIALSASLAMAQTQECATIVTEEQLQAEYDRLDKYAEMMMRDDGLHYSIPITFHIVRRSDGTGGFTLDELDSIIDTTNMMYVPMNVSIYQYGPVDFIDSDGFFYDMDDNGDWNSLRQTNTIPEALNIYFVQPTDTSGFGYCGLSSFTTSAVQGIIMNVICASASNNKSTMAHEIGHYFDLYHTHETFFGDECPDGSNCSATGDLICDTPADPNLYSGGTYYVTDYPECAYIDIPEPPPACGPEPYNPQTENLMSYSRKLCRDLFTAGQTDKFRTVMINLRTELFYGIEGFFVLPSGFEGSVVSLGSTFDSTITIKWAYPDPVDIISSSNSLGRLSVSGSFPTQLNQGDSMIIDVSFDASDLLSQCDLGNYYDTISITTTSPTLLQIDIPFELSIAYLQPDYAQKQIGPSCLRLTVPNTPAIGDISSQAFYADGKNHLYDGSLLIGMIDGTDTVVYMDFFSQQDFTVIDSFIPGVDLPGRQTQTLRFATPDNKIHGEAKYIYGYSDQDLDSCQYILIDYIFSNPCDTAITFIPGIACDFEVDTDIGFENNATTSAIYDYVQVHNPNTGKHCGLASLYNCTGQTVLRPIDNTVLIWPNGYLTDRDAYTELAAPSDGDSVALTDVSALISFGPITLAQGEEARYRAALLYNNDNPDNLDETILDIFNLEIYPAYDLDNDCILTSEDNCPDVYNPDQLDSDQNGIGDACEFTYMCGDTNDDGAVNVSDAVWIINYVFVGGPAPEPLAAGDANCDSAVDISDAVWIINFVFVDGNDPCDINGDGLPDC